MAGGLKEVRERISSVTSTQQITRAMKMVSASKLRRAADTIIQIRPYTLRLQEMLGHVLGSLGKDEMVGNTQFAEQRSPEKVLIVLITSDRGLCGAFNTNLIKTAETLIHEKYSAQDAAGNVQLLTIGKRGFDALKDHDRAVNSTFVQLFHHLSFDESKKATNYILSAFKNYDVDRVEVVFAEFKNAAVQTIKGEQFLPVKLPEVDTALETAFRPDYLFEPDKQKLLDELVPKILRSQFHRYLLDNNASEHGARMMAMEQATENANELLKELRLSYNRARQAAITTEISEIVGGSAALEG